VKSGETVGKLLTLVGQFSTIL